MRIITITISLIAALFTLTSSLFSQTQSPWGPNPNWQSTDESFTMSVAFADIDLDGDLDLLAVNYKYPYDDFSSGPQELETSAIGDYFVAYENINGTLSSTPDTFTTIPRCIDCIDVADYDQDGDPDVVLGLVVGKGQDGGILVLNNLHSGTTSFEDHFSDSPSGGYINYEGASNNDSYDCHCVRWVDVNNDGELEIAALEIPGIVHFYENENSVIGPMVNYPVIEFITTPPQHAVYLTPKTDNNYRLSTDYSLAATTIEFGDINDDGYLDMFMNIFKYGDAADNTYLIIYKNRIGVPGVTQPFDPEHLWGVTGRNYTDDNFCGSFGHIEYSGVKKLALVTGSMNFHGQTGLSSPERMKQPYGNDILIYHNDQLIHIGKSEVNSTEPAQLVTDIQWVQLDDTSSMDIVAVSYPVYKGNATNGYSWDRGHELVHMNPGDYLSSSDNDFPSEIWSNTDNPALSTSLALGDLDYDGTSSYNKTHAVSYSSSAYKSLQYLLYYPFVNLISVKFTDNVGYTLSEWINGDPSNSDFNVVFNTQNGWVIIDKDYPIPTGTSEIVYSYKYSSEFDLAVGNDGKNAVYEWGATTGNDYDSPNTTIDNLPPVYGSEKTYRKIDTDLDSLVYDAMTKECLGFTGEVYAPNDFQPFLSNHPEMLNVGVQGSWRAIEIFKGHYFWDYFDKNLEKIRQHGGTSHIISWHDPIWSRGNYEYQSGSIWANDEKKRASRMELNTMYVRNLVNRYRPEGMLDECGEYDWGDWGVDIYQFENEPNTPNFGYGNFPSDNSSRIDICKKTFFQYQMIKSIAYGAYTDQDKLKLVSPNWAPEYFKGETLPAGEDIVICPDMPYLNLLHDPTETPWSAAVNSDHDELLWHYCDYIAVQIYGALKPRGGVFEGGNCDFIDVFASDTVSTDDRLDVGFEHQLWGFYTEGLDDYVITDHGLSGFGASEWDPVMISDVNGEEYDYEKPFFIFDVILSNSWTGTMGEIPDSEIPVDDWMAARIAEMFSVDVYPGDTTRNKQLVERFPNRWIQFDDAFFTLAPLMNKDNNDFIDYEAIDINLNEPDSKLHHYVYQGNNIGEPAKYVHFLKTNQPWDGVDPLEADFNPDLFNVSGYTFQGLKISNLVYSAVDYPKVTCYSPFGGMYQKDVEYDSTLSKYCVDFAGGELGPAMVIMVEDITMMDDGYTQGIQLYGDEEYYEYISRGHGGWNLVSWNIEPISAVDIEVIDLLPNDTSGNHEWFYKYPTSKVFNYLSHDAFFPVYSSMPWDLKQAYYIYLEESHLWDEFTDRPLLNTTIDWTNNTFDPDTSWADLVAGNLGSLTSEWFFMPYPLNGYTKIASEPKSLYDSTGVDTLYDYVGPFHYLIWDSTNSYNPGNLVAIKSDNGKVFIPLAGSNPLDNIEVLTPGRGYFLGFCGDTSNIYSYPNWNQYPEWVTASAAGGNKSSGSSSSQTASATCNHFYFKPYTQWFYPVIIDTVDLEECPMEPGDEIAVFDGELCVGAVTFTGEFPLILDAWKDDIITPEEMDGYKANNTMAFIWYDASENMEVEFEIPPATNSAIDDPVAPTHSGFGAGMYAVRSFINGIASVTQLPVSFALGHNYPNPFNAVTIIPFELPERSKVKIELFNVRGQLVDILHDGMENAGYRKIKVKMDNMSSGVYFYRFSALGMEKGVRFNQVDKLLLIK